VNISYAGEIDVDEMVEIFCLMYSVQVRAAWLHNISMFSSQGYTEEEATERALGIFESLDKNGDGSLAEDEFIKARQEL
jgi:Ca2+-binding EF-hand superfamily protein